MAEVQAVAVALMAGAAVMAVVTEALVAKQFWGWQQKVVVVGVVVWR
jgi:hypothetical protein